MRLFREVHHLEKAVERKEWELEVSVTDLNQEEYADYCRITVDLAKEWDK